MMQAQFNQREKEELLRIVRGVINNMPEGMRVGSQEAYEYVLRVSEQWPALEANLARFIGRRSGGTLVKELIDGVITFKNGECCVGVLAALINESKQ